MRTNKSPVPAKMRRLKGKYHGAIATEPKIAKRGKQKVANSDGEALGATCGTRPMAIPASGHALNTMAAETAKSNERFSAANFQ